MLIKKTLCYKSSRTMQIILTNTFSPKYTPDKTFRENNPNRGQVNFCAMKKSQFKGFELECVNRFKAPIEKFNSIDDLKNWAEDLFSKKLDVNKYHCNDCFVNAEREDIIANWKLFFNSDKNFKKNPALSLIISEDITKGLSAKNHDIPPILYPKVLIQTLRQIRKNMAQNKGYFFNFDKIYKQNLRGQVTKDVETIIDTKDNKWIKIPSADSDPKNFDINVEKLKILSSRHWCTKFTHARPYLSAGDFYLYLEKGNPKACIRMLNDSITEIKGEKNYEAIPCNYIDEINELINREHLDFRLVKNNLDKAKAAQKEVENLKLQLEPLIKNNERENILKLFNIRAKIDNEGRMTISHFAQPSELYTFEDIGIVEDNLFKGLFKIERNADFSKSRLTTLETLETIGHDANFSHSIIRKAPALRSIGGLAKFSQSRLTDAHNLETIGFNAWMRDCSDIDFSALKEVGGDLYIEDSKINFPNLETVSGKIHTRNCSSCFPKLNR